MDGRAGSMGRGVAHKRSVSMRTWALEITKGISKNNLANCCAYWLLIFMGKISISDGKTTTIVSRNSNNLRWSAATHVPCPSLLVSQVGRRDPRGKRCTCSHTVS